MDDNELAREDKSELTEGDKSVLQAMLHTATPVPPGGVLVCTLKEEGSVDPEKPDQWQSIKATADSLRDRGYFEGEGNKYFPTQAAYDALK